MSSPTQLYERLAALSNAIGVSGDESEVRQIILAALKDRAAEVTIDPMGNVIARCAGSGASKARVLVSAYMDEAGLMVSDVSESGLISVMAVGALDFRYLPARRVSVGKDKLPGVTLWAPIHKTHGQSSVMDPDDMQIDVGADNKGGARARPGDRIGFSSVYTALSGGIVRGKAFESRAGCAVLLELLDGDPYPFDLYLAFTSQALIGGRGAKIAANRVAPQLAIALNGVVSNDLPQLPDVDMVAPIRLGGGPVISSMESIFVADRIVIDHLRKTAQTGSIALQIDAQIRRASQASAINDAHSGVPIATLSIPVRYMGSPNELIDLSDVETLSRLLNAALRSLTPELLNA